MAQDQSPRAPQISLADEARAEEGRAAFVEEGKARLTPRCPICGAIGSLEEFAGETRCIACDEVVAAKTKLSGFGRR